MDNAEKIRQDLKRMASEFGPDNSLLATVKSVNLDAKTCDLADDDGLEFPDVRLRPVESNNQGWMLVPKVNTWALALRIEDGGDWMLIAADELEAVRLVCEDIQINGGENGGLVKWPSAKTQLDLVMDFIQAVKTVVEGAPIPEPGSGAPSAFQTALSGAIAAINAPSFEDLENLKVKH